MGVMDVKKELFWGYVMTALAIALTIYLGFSYKQALSPQVSAPQTGNPAANQTANPSNNPASPSKGVTMTDVAKHNTPADCWIVIHGKVLNITPYLNLHPGGSGTITPYCGGDASEAFDTKGGMGRHSSYAVSLIENFVIGLLGQNLAPSDTTKTIGTTNTNSNNNIINNFNNNREDD